MMNPDISVIVPVYNTEMYLSRCLSSICNQTYKNIEIIVINDGSSDNSPAIIEKYARFDKRIVPINQENTGLGLARNRGLSIAKGKYVSFVDSDDWIELDMLEKMFNVAKKIKADIVVCNYVMSFSNGKKVKNQPFSNKIIQKDDIYKTNFHYDYFYGGYSGKPVWNKLYRSKFLKDNNLMFKKNDEIFAEDFLFNLECLLYKPKIAFINEYLYNYYQRVGSIINSFKPNLSERYLNLILNYYKKITDLGLQSKLMGSLAIVCFDAISASMYNAFKYPDRCEKGMRGELEYFLRSDIVHYCMNELAKGKYLNDINNKQWKKLARLFSFFVSKNWNILACLLQLIRFKIFTDNKKRFR